MKTIRSKLYLIAVQIVSLLLVITSLGAVIYQLTGAVTLLFVGVYPLLYIVSIAIVYLIYQIAISGSLKKYIYKLKIRKTLEKNLLAIGAYTECKVLSAAILPNIRIENNYIKISLPNMIIRKKIENDFDILSTALPEGMRVIGSSISRDGCKCQIKFLDDKLNTKWSFNTSDDYVKAIKKLDKYELMIDYYQTLDFRIHTGIMITGSSGSGKSYLTRSIIYQTLLKDFKVYVLDYKRSYQILEDLVSYKYDDKDIIVSLEEICAEIDHRKEVMSPILKNNPDAIAGDSGLKPMLIVVEEMLALMSNLDSKGQKHVTELLTKITTTGRSLSVYLCIVMQVSSAESLSTNIRANLPVKLVLGQGNETIYRTAFGLSNVPSLNYQLKRGEGIGNIEGNNFLFKVPELKFNLTELNNLLALNREGAHPFSIDAEEKCVT